jgi:putative ABC transport system permease protein
MRASLTRFAGMGVASLAALAVLALGCVFAATAGPREALATRTQALHQSLAATSPLARSFAVTSTWSAVSSNFAQANPYGPARVNLTEDQFSEITSQLRADFGNGVVRLAPSGEDWAAMTSTPYGVTSRLPTSGIPVELQVDYRQPFTQYTRLVAGRYPAAQAPTPIALPAPSRSPARSRTRSRRSRVPKLMLQVAVSEQTASQFRLRPGSKVDMTGPVVAAVGRPAEIVLDVTGIVAPIDAKSTFWTADPTATVPDLVTSRKTPPYWVGEVLAGPGEIDAVQTYFGPQGLELNWQLPIDVAALNGDQAQPLYNTLNKLVSQAPALKGDVARLGSVLTVNVGLLQPLLSFISTAQAVDTLLWLVYVSLAVAGLVTLLLAARMVVLRRAEELAMRRARGASLAQIGVTVARGAAIACVPAGVLAAVLAVVAVPGPVPAGGWWPLAATVAAAVAAPAAVAVWGQRLPRRRARGRRRGRGRARLVVEATACLAAVAGIIVFRQQGTAPGSGVNLYTSAAPVLIAVPAVIVVLRVYPLVLRALLRGSARGAGASTFVGLARAARTALTPALPAFALVLALTVAAFAGTVRDAVTRGEVAASWQAAGADITASETNGEFITAAAVRAAAAVPGVTHATAVWDSTWTAPDNQQITGVGVDPAQYAALVSGTQTFPPVPAGLLTAGTPQPVLASPAAAAAIGGTGTLTTQSGIAPLKVHVAALLPATPAAPGTGTAFVIMPVAAIRGQTGPAPLNTLLITGPHIDTTALTAVLAKTLPDAAITYRSAILNTLTSAPLQHGTFVLFALALATAAILGLAVMLLELALGAAERETTLARLAAMGLGEGQRARVVTLEVLPAVIAAATAAAASAYLLPKIVAPAIDLSVFTGTGNVALAPDPTALTIPLAGLLVAAALALTIQIRSERRHGVTGTLRIGE